VAFNKSSEQAEKASVATETVLWGCLITNFKATLPFNRMKQSRRGGIAAFKRDPTALHYQGLKVIMRIADQRQKPITIDQTTQIEYTNSE
jgi:hypothetical protein